MFVAGCRPCHLFVCANNKKSHKQSLEEKETKFGGERRSNDTFSGSLPTFSPELL
jgi:hypothetical protein